MGVKKKWICVDCGFIYEGEEPPDPCPQCFSPREAFKELAGA